MQKEFKFKLGADPEFSFVLQGRRVTALELLQMNLKGKKGFTSTNNGYKCEGGTIGWDGCNATAELRPNPAKTPAEITSNIKKILKKTYETLPTFDMSILSTYAPVGGHIHFEIDEATHNNSQKIKLIHKKISSFFLPIMISENKINLRIRTKGNGYGTLTDFHGGTSNGNSFPIKDKEGNIKYEYTYEFRTPSAEWLATEKICEATFAYMGVVFNEIMNKPANFAKHMGIVYKNNDQAEALHKLALSDYIGITEGLFLQIKKAVKTFELYNDYKEQIDYIMNPKKIMEDKKKTEYNIIKGWNFMKNKKINQPTIKELTNEKKFKEQSGKLDLDRMSNLMNISYNEDTNCNLFVKTLSEKATAFNWKLLNNYFIFGLRKGIKETLIFNQDKQVIMGKEIIKTISDRDTLTILMDKIIKKYIGSQNKTIDINNGNIKKHEVLIIGLPYKMRVDKKVNSFISIIHKMEKNKMKAESIMVDNKNIIDDRNDPKGEFYNIVFDIKKEKEKVTNNVPFDTTSQGLRLAEEAKHNIIREEEINERENREPVERIDQTGIRQPSDMENYYWDDWLRKRNSYTWQEWLDFVEEGGNEVERWRQNDIIQIEGAITPEMSGILTTTTAETENTMIEGTTTALTEEMIRTAAINGTGFIRAPQMNLEASSTTHYPPGHWTRGM